MSAGEAVIYVRCPADLKRRLVDVAGPDGLSAFVREELTSVVAYPICSECEVPWVRRRSFVFPAGGEKWVFQRDCKHKAAEAKLVETRGARRGGRR